MLNIISFTVYEYVYSFLNEKDRNILMQVCQRLYKFAYLHKLNYIHDTKFADIMLKDKRCNIQFDFDVNASGPIFIIFGNDYVQYIDRVPINIDIYDVNVLHFSGILTNKFNKLSNNTNIITFGDYFDSYYYLPNSIIHITCGRNFNQNVKMIPNNTATIRFGDKFNKSINKLSDSVQTITLGRDFNRSIKKLPTNLVKIEFGYYFNKKISRINKNLSEIIFGYSFNRSINVLHDSNIMKLVFGYMFNKPTKFPQSLKILRFGKYFNSACEYPNLDVLEFGDYFDQDISNLPTSLKTLSFGNSFDRSIEQLLLKTTNLISLKISRIYRHPIGLVPNSLVNILSLIHI